MYARLTSLNIGALVLFPVTVADSSIRKASSGGVAANKPSSLPVDLFCHQPRSHVHVVSVSFVVVNTHFTLMGGLLVFSKHSSMGLFSCTFIFLYHSISRAACPLNCFRVLGRRYHSFKERQDTKRQISTRADDDSVGMQRVKHNLAGDAKEIRQREKNETTGMC